MKLTKRNRLLKFQYLADSPEHCGIWHEREEEFFNCDIKVYQKVILGIETVLRAEGVKVEEVRNYNDLILNNFNRLLTHPYHYKLLEVIEESNIGKGAL